MENLTLGKKALNQFLGAVRKKDYNYGFDLYQNYNYTKIVLFTNFGNETTVLKFIPIELLKDWDLNLNQNWFIVGFNRYLKKYGLEVDYAEKNDNHEILIGLHKYDE